MFSEEVKISYTSIGDSAAMEILGFISINAKANAIYKSLIINWNFYKIIEAYDIYFLKYFISP